MKTNSKTDNTQLNYLYYIKDAMINRYISNMVVKSHSENCLDIIVEVSHKDKINPIINMIEANIYTKKELRANEVCRVHNSINVTTSDNKTIRIFAYNKMDFNKIALGKLK